jgi:hypothetical protein
MYKKLLIISFATLVSLYSSFAYSSSSAIAVCNSCTEEKRKVVALETVLSGIVEIVDITTGQLYTYRIDEEVGTQPPASPYPSSFPDAPNRMVSTSFNLPDSIAAAQEAKSVVESLISNGATYDEHLNRLTLGTVKIPDHIATSASGCVSDAGCLIDVSSYVRVQNANGIIDMLSAKALSFFLGIKTVSIAEFTDKSVATFIFTTNLGTISYVYLKASAKFQNGTAIPDSRSSSSPSSGSGDSIGYTTGASDFNIANQLYKHCFTYTVERDGQDPVKSYQCYFSTSPLG